MDPAVHTTIDADAVATLWIDLPGRSVNTLTTRVLDDLAAAIAALADTPPLAGVVIASGKAGSFVAGADLFELRDMSPDQVEAYAAKGQALMDQLAGFPVPTVAAIAGDCLGGGLELALACDYRIAADEGRISLGVPELKLGLTPAWGATVRLPHLVGLGPALELLREASLLPPRRALALGLIDAVVPAPDVLGAAHRHVSAGPKRHRPPLGTRLHDSVAPLRRHTCLAAQREAENPAHPPCPAITALLETVNAGCTAGPDAALHAERQSLARLVQTDTARNLIRLFFLRREARHWTARAGVPAPLTHVAVMGAGATGTALTGAMVRAGINVHLIDPDADALSAARRGVGQLLHAEVTADRLDAPAADHLLSHLTTDTAWSALDQAALVCVTSGTTTDELSETFMRLGRLASPTAVLASVTSLVPVAGLTTGVVNPQRVLGLHPAAAPPHDGGAEEEAPVARLALLEIVPLGGTGGGALATALSLGPRLGLPAFVVGDGPGFLADRLTLVYFTEGLRLAGEGTAIDQIDTAMHAWGMAAGPFAWMDDIGLDTAVEALVSLSRPLGGRVGATAGLEMIVDRGWLGRKSGCGFYDYGHGVPGRHPGRVNHAMAELLCVGARPCRSDDIADRLVGPMINEAALALGAGIVDRAEAIDLMSVIALGFPGFRGGLMHHADLNLRQATSNVQHSEG